MRTGVLIAMLATSAPALADPGDRLEATGFLGLMDFSESIGLGGSLSPEQRPQTAPTFGARLTYTALRLGGRYHLAVAPEAELSFTPSWTGYGFDGPRNSYFAPVFGYRLNLMLRLAGGWLQPHVSAGFGGATVVSASPYMKKETDPVLVWGVGATFPMTDRWQLRFDAHQGFMESMTGSTTSNFELLVAVGARFGLATKSEPVTETVVVVTPPLRAPEPDKDSDGDGIPDRLDTCPSEAETVNGIEDQDGCPEPDLDGDRILSPADKCPDQPEDFDKFEDEDGCPDDDNDKDGIADAKDACPNQPETKNGFSDEDGCPDQVPPSVIAALATASTIKFEAKRARLTEKAKTGLEKALAVMLENPKLKVFVTVHPEKANDDATQLAFKRAEVVKWHLVEQGVGAAQLATTVGSVLDARKPSLLELLVAQ